MTSPNLPTVKLSRLKDKRHATAVGILSYGLGKAMPHGLIDSDDLPNMLVETSLGAMSEAGLGTVGDGIETGVIKGLAGLVFLLTMPFRLSFHSGDLTLVTDARRFDLVEVLTKIQVALDNQRIRLVSPNILFSDACYNYRWRGTVFSFALGISKTSIRAEYVAWHPSSEFAPSSNLGLSILNVSQRKNSNDRGRI